MPIHMHFKRGGGVVIRPNGYPGATCHEATRTYLEAMGGEQHTREAPEDTDAPHIHAQQEHQQERQ